MRVSKEQREALREHVALSVSKWGGQVNPGLPAYEAQALLDDLVDAEQRAERAERERDAYRKAKQENDERFQIAAAEQRERAERAEAELAALRERVRTLAWTFEALGKHAHADGLRDLLDDDTTGAASGEGEK